MLKNQNVKLMIYIIVFVIVFLGIGTILVNSLLNSNEDENAYRTDEDISTPVVDNVGLPDGEINLKNKTVERLFDYFREDHNCMYNYVNNISGTNSSKLAITYNYLVDKSAIVSSCGSYNTLVIGNRYFCGNSIDISRNHYNQGINSSEFINYLKGTNTFELDGALFDNEINNIFGKGVGYVKEDFLYGDDSYIHYDGSINKFIMFKYYNDNEVCRDYNEVLVGAVSKNGTLEIRSKLMDGNDVVRNITRVYKFNPNTGEYLFQNRYAG